MRSPRAMRSEKSLTMARPPIALADALGLDHLHAGRRRRTGRDGGAAGGGAVAPALLAQCLQLPDAAHVALAPGGDAVAHPMLFGDDLARELVLLALLLGQQRVAPFLEMGKAALDAPGLAAIEPDRLARQVREETPVVADDDQRGAPPVELAFQPFDGGEIEMVGRLVQQQDVRRRRQHAGERGTPRLAAGEAGRILFAAQTELAQEMARHVGVIARRQAGLDIGKRAGKAREVRLLRQIAHQRARLHEHRAAVRLDQTGRDLEQSRFARAIASDQRHALAGRDRQLRPGQQRRAAEGECDVFELQERWGHGAPKSVIPGRRASGGPNPYAAAPGLWIPGSGAEFIIGPRFARTALARAPE